MIINRLVKVHILDDNYSYVGDGLALRVTNKVRLISSLKLYDIIDKDGEIYIKVSNNDSSDNYVRYFLTGVAIAIAIIALTRPSRCSNNTEIDQLVVPIDTTVIEDRTLDSLFSETSQYILKVAPESNLSADLLITKCLEYDIDPAFVLAQGHLESHFGTRGLASRTNSVWNVYAYDGKDYSKVSEHGKYPTPDDSIEPYLRCLSSRYLPNCSISYLLVEFVDVDGHRYASDRSYEVLLKSIYDKIVNTTNINKLYHELKGVA